MKTENSGIINFKTRPPVMSKIKVYTGPNTAAYGLVTEVKHVVDYDGINPIIHEVAVIELVDKPFDLFDIDFFLDGKKVVIN